MVKALTAWLNSVIFNMEEVLLSSLKDSRRELMGAALVNIGVLLLTAGAVSDSYLKFKFSTRILIISLGILSFALGIRIFPNRDNKEDK